jgi:hypothetical protein
VVDRPYFKTSIQELEQMFVANSNDLELRKQLFHELGFRKTGRAQKLKKKIEEELSGGDSLPLFSLAPETAPPSKEEFSAINFWRSRLGLISNKDGK